MKFTIPIPLQQGHEALQDELRRAPGFGLCCASVPIRR